MKYKNGYMEKIGYWQYKFDKFKANNDLSSMIYALDKLTYFVKRQKEVYGTI